MTGKIILVNGPSSSGKSTLCAGLQDALGEPFWHYSIDHLRHGDVLPRQRIERGDFAWPDMREAFFEGFHRCLPALAGAGNNLVVEHIVETRTWMTRLIHLLEPFDVFFVGLNCPLPELESRELRRGDRRIGEAREDLTFVHTLVREFGTYDLEIEATRPLAESVDVVLHAWQRRSRSGAFARMRAALPQTSQNAR